MGDDLLRAPVIVRGLLGEEDIAAIRSYVEQGTARGELALGDHLVPDGMFTYSAPVLEPYLVALRPRMEQIVGKDLTPTFSYLRLYRMGNRLPRHTDRDACELCVSIHVFSESEHSWDLWIEHGGRAEPEDLRPGDGVVFLGREWPHWREEFRGRSYCGFFLHYVDVRGPHRQWAWDGRGTPEQQQSY